MTPLSAMVSYQSKDAEAAELLHLELALRGLDVIHDRCTFQAGGRIPSQMADGVERCDALVIYLTRNSLYLDSPGAPRPAIDGEFVPAMRRRRRELSRHPDWPPSAVRPVVVPITHGLGDPRSEAPDVVRRETGEDISSLWAPTIDQTTPSITQAEAAMVAKRVLDSLLPPGEGPADVPLEVSVATRGTSQPPAALTVDATPLLGGDTPRPGEPSDWARYLVALRDVQATLVRHGRSRELRLQVNAHLTGAIAFGLVFNQAAGWGLEVRARHGWAAYRDAPDSAGLNIGWDRLFGSADLSVEVDVLGRNVTDLADGVIATLADPPCGRLQVTRPAGADLMPAEVAAMASLTAAAIRRRVDECRPRRVHLMCAAPVEFGVLLGHRLTSLRADLHLYELSANQYVPSLVVPT
jgi:CBASS immunity sensor of nucleotide second messenger signals/TIR domain-containing protein